MVQPSTPILLPLPQRFCEGQIMVPDFVQQECVAPALTPRPPTPAASPISTTSCRVFTPVHRMSLSSCWNRCDSPEATPPAKPGTCETPRGPTSSARRSWLEKVNMTPCTPEAKSYIVQDTPPAAPQLFMSNVQDEIDEALLKEDVPLLSLALLQGHQCNSGHVLFEAVRRQHLPALEFLLNRGLNPDEHCCGRRPLHIAMQSCMAEDDVGYRMAELLLRKGARPGVQLGDDPLQQSPLHSTAARCCPPAMSLLLKYGADPTEGDARGDTPLHLACRLAPPHRSPPPIYETDVVIPPLQDRSFVEMAVTLLLRHGACPVQGDAAGLPPAIFVSRNNRTLKKLLARAEQWWSRRALLLVCAHFVTERTSVDASSALSACLCQPDISRTIVEFL